MYIIYGLYRDDELVYIGQTNQLIQYRLNTEYKFEFDHYRELGIVYSDIDARRLEFELIQKYGPIENIQLKKPRLINWETLLPLVEMNSPLHKKVGVPVFQIVNIS